MNRSKHIDVAHKLDDMYACRNDAEYCGRDEQGNDIYVFKIHEIKIEQRDWCGDRDFAIFVRGKDTYWMNIDSCFLLESESELLEYVEIQHTKKLLETKTYTISTKDGVTL